MTLKISTDMRRLYELRDVAKAFIAARDAAGGALDDTVRESATTYLTAAEPLLIIDAVEAIDFMRIDLNREGILAQAVEYNAQNVAAREAMACGYCDATIPTPDGDATQMRAHVVKCPKNPLVVEIDRLHRDLWRYRILADAARLMVPDWNDTSGAHTRVDAMNLHCTAIAAAIKNIDAAEGGVTPTNHLHTLLKRWIQGEWEVYHPSTCQSVGDVMGGHAPRCDCGLEALVTDTEAVLGLSSGGEQVGG